MNFRKKILSDKIVNLYIYLISVFNLCSYFSEIPTRTKMIYLNVHMDV